MAHVAIGAPADSSCTKNLNNDSGIRLRSRRQSLYLQSLRDAAAHPPRSLTYAPPFIILLLRGAATRSVAIISLPFFLSGFGIGY